MELELILIRFRRVKITWKIF